MKPTVLDVLGAAALGIALGVMFALGV